jgi:hypothetical protein
VENIDKEIKLNDGNVDKEYHCISRQVNGKTINEANSKNIFLGDLLKS